ncbi:MAG: LON peptidase substrate-binding domain-containing protein [Gordonia sp. (in: high G+C Gram-positive bacteria)]
MFPLGTALLPGEPLPLRIFEPRYRQLLADCLDGDRRFGVVLIARGSEVGGGETRHNLGTFAEIDRVRRAPDGQASISCRGTDRFEVIEWLPDDPYPRARVRLLAPPPHTAADRDKLVGVGASIRAVIAEAYSRADTKTPAATPAFDSADLDAVGVFGWAARLPIQAADRQRLLAARDVSAQAEILADAVEGIAARIRFGH